MAQERLRRWVSFLALCGVLERAVSEGILDTYYLKGGVAMELRYAEAARATKDIDIGISGNRGDRLMVFRDATALGFDDFTFQLKGKPLNMDKVDAVRLELAVRYRTRAWQTIEVDLGSSGEGAVDFVKPAIPGLAAMGLRVPSPVRCLNLSEQVAQKLHACTGPYSQGRARDVLDILLVDLLGRLDITTVRLAAKQVFIQRATHDFPPSSRIPADWHSELEALANELGYPAISAAEIEVRFGAFVDLVAGRS
ncbi:MAG: nucleotidyl transferase AbiEii/AbiGii toxin family protein [Acidobacteriales bacterium]|nr:nucleotidyl transferase AbiEii/AbiGii toxin family protein [Terriglobales bacterium]